MATTNDSLVVRVQESFRQLSTSANQLNEVSDELARAIDRLEEILKKLNLGVAAWVSIAEGDDSPFSPTWWARQIGYAKLGNKWGIALRTLSGDLSHPDEDSEQVWSFNEAPRWIRIEAVDHIPQLIESLSKEADEMAARIKQKVVRAHQLSDAVLASAMEPKAGSIGERQGGKNK